jgi:hypothetical protein
MDTVILILQILLAIGAWLAYLYLKQLPDTIYKVSLKEIELNLSKQLEEFKSSLTKEVELLKISQSQLQAHKTQEFVKLSEYFGEILTDKEKLAKILRTPKEATVWRKNMYNLGVSLFFFASDWTIKQYIEWREQSTQTDPNNSEPKKILRLYGELMVSIRKDLGYEDTSCNADDFLRIILNDWEEYKVKVPSHEA